MQIAFQYKMSQLHQVIGEKKLRQLGLLPCSTCSTLPHARKKLGDTEEIANLTHYHLELAPEFSLQSALGTIYRDPKSAKDMYSSIKDTLSCPECGTSYKNTQEELLSPLSPFLSDVEAYLLKGMIIDIYL